MTTQTATPSNLTTDEQNALRWAGFMALTPGESRELLHFLGYPTLLPLSKAARILAVVEKIAATRTAAVEAETRPAMPGILFNSEACDAWLQSLDRMSGWEVTATRTDGTTVEGVLASSGYDPDNSGLAGISLQVRGTGLVLVSSEDLATIYVH